MVIGSGGGGGGAGGSIAIIVVLVASTEELRGSQHSTPIAGVGVDAERCRETSSCRRVQRHLDPGFSQRRRECFKERLIGRYSEHKAIVLYRQHNSARLTSPAAFEAHKLYSRPGQSFHRPPPSNYHCASFVQSLTLIWPGWSN